MEELRQLLAAYARRGLVDWKRTPEDVKVRARKCLAWKIAEQEGVADQTIRAAFQGSLDVPRNFIPMPKVPGRDRDSIVSFFLPFRRAPDDMQCAIFDLFVIVDMEHSLGFRFEPADAIDHAHNYAHVQMNLRMMNKSMDVQGVPGWIPTSYPAFPLRTDGPLEMFLAMATSVHGRHRDGVGQVIQEALVGNARVSRMCLDRLTFLYR